MFFRVGSDDFITLDAMEKIEKYKYLCKDENICALVFLTKNVKTNKLVGYHPFSEIKLSDFFEYRQKYHAKGDRAEVVKTNILKEIPYPCFEGEKFCPEGLMWNRIADKYKACYIPEFIYVREYCED